MAMNPSQADHWQANRRLSATLLTIWLLANASVIVFAEELNRLSFIGPLGFYLAAQGLPLLYLAIIGVYSWCMRRIDERCGLVENNIE